MFSVSKNIAAIIPYLWVNQDKRNKLLTVATFFCVALTIGLNLSVPLIFKEIVNTLSEYEQNKLTLSLALLVAYGFCWLGGRYFEKLREMIFFRPVSTAITEYSVDVFDHIHAQSLKFHLDRETGKISSAIQKAQLAIAMIVTNLLFRIFPVFIEAIFTFFILWTVVGLKISIVMIVTLIAYLIANYFVMSVFKKAEKTYQDVDIIVDKRVVDSFLNSENIKFLNSEQYEAKVADKLFRKREDAIINVFWAGTFSTTFQAVLLGLGLVTISYFVAQDVLAGKLEVGDFVLVNGYLILLFNPLESITGFIRKTISFSGDLSHSTSLLQESHSIVDQKDAKDISLQDAEIDFRNVSFHYIDKTQPILQDFNLTIPERSTVALVGSSGSGKSTISRLLFRFYDIDDGSIIIDGQDIKSVKKESLRKSIAFVPQDIVLLNKSLRANIIYGNEDVSDLKLNAIIKAVHLDELISKLPEGTDTIVGERGVKLSGGEKQRIAIARALLRTPKIIIFDEATSSLDTETEKKIQQNIYEVTSNITTILIAHRLETVIHADKIVFLDKGKIVEEGSHGELLSLNGHYARLWGQQHESK